MVKKSTKKADDTTAEVSAVITSVVKDRVRKTGERFLDVTVEITDGGEKEIVKRGFPIDASDEDIKAEITKMLETRKGEQAQAVEQAVLDAEDAVADETIGKLEGAEIKG